METSTSRVQKYREALRNSGMRPIQIWVPDTRQENFAQECVRQSKLAAKSDLIDSNLMHLMDESLTEIDGWDS